VIKAFPCRRLPLLAGEPYNGSFQLFRLISTVPNRRFTQVNRSDK
jgi:hypothetical protein